MHNRDQHKIWQKLAKVKNILAVSGGKDSMALLHYILKRQLIPRQQIVVVYVNHNLRTPHEVTKDQSLIREMCQKNKLTYVCKTISTDTWQKKQNIEARARKLRYQLLEEAQREHQADYIITAHHLGDQIETICLQYVRGAGLRGLIGMPQISQQQIVRPWLTKTPQEIAAYVDQHNVAYNEDITNQDQSIARNQLRTWLQKQLPELYATSQQNPVCYLQKKIQETYVRTMLNLLKISTIQQISSKASNQDSLLFVMNRKQLRQLPSVAVRQLLHFLTAGSKLQKRKTITQITRALRGPTSGQQFTDQNTLLYIGPKLIKIFPQCTSIANIVASSVQTQTDGSIKQIGVRIGDQYIKDGTARSFNRFCKKHKIDLHQRQNLCLIKSVAGFIISVPELGLEFNGSLSAD